LLLASFFGDVADIHQFLVEQERQQKEHHRNVRPRPGFADRADPGRQAADAGQLVIDLDAGFFLVGGGERLLEVFVEGFDERALMQEGQRLALRLRRPRADRSGGGPEPGELEKPAA
jgi:hypothetical protein